jgi:heterodisulfide reductase subunit A
MPGEDGAPRIGVYVCHCGSRIAGTLDVKAVAESAAKLPHVVVSRDHAHICSDRAQRLLRRDIDEYALDRIVVASCSPLLRERPFTAIAAGVTARPVALHLVNLRDHNPRLHQRPEAATGTANDVVRAAVQRAACDGTPEPPHAPIHPDVLVVGGGIAGIEAALALADGGRNVYLVERQPSLGGHMARFGQIFPTLDCAACILTPKMSAVRAHPNIRLWSCSEVTHVEGEVGNYRVQVARHPRYVTEERCTGCLECVEACVYEEARFPDTFTLGLGRRKPVYVPFADATPDAVLIDRETCLAFAPGGCAAPCVEACGERRAINLQQQEEVKTVTVGAIILATGFRPFDVSRTPCYGYGMYPNVYTALEVEHVLNASGPTGGQVTLRDGHAPKSIAIVHCVGSRDVTTNRWCSRVCCMYSLKLAHLLRARTGAEVFNFYIDMRTPGMEFEEFYQKVLKEGVHFIRGRVAEVTDWALDPSEEGKLVIRVEDTLLGTVRRVPVDMVVLSVGLEPHTDARDVARLFKVTDSPEAFFREQHSRLTAAGRCADGIFVAGCCEGPKDLHDTVAQAGAVAAEILALVDRVRVEPGP